MDQNRCTFSRTFLILEINGPFRAIQNQCRFDYFYPGFNFALSVHPYAIFLYDKVCGKPKFLVLKLGLRENNALENNSNLGGFEGPMTTFI